MLSKFLFTFMVSAVMASNDSNATTAAPSGNATQAPSGNATQAPSGNATQAPSGNATAAPTTVAPAAATTVAPAAATTVAPGAATTVAAAAATTVAAASNTTSAGGHDDGHTKADHAAASNETFAATTVDISSPQTVAMSGVAASVTGSCKQSTQLMNIVMLSTMKAFVDTLSTVKDGDADFGKMLGAFCNADGSLTAMGGACLDRAAPTSSGLAAGGVFDSATKMMTVPATGCARRVRQLAGNATGAAVSVSDAPMFKLSTTNLAMAPTAMATLTTKMKDPATMTAMNALVVSTQAAITTALKTGDANAMVAILGALPAVIVPGTQTGVAISPGIVVGTPSLDPAAAMTDINAAATTADAATVTADVSAPVVVDNGATTSSAAGVFVSFAAFVGAFLMV